MGCNIFGSFGCRHDSNHSRHMDDSRRVQSDRNSYDMHHDMHWDMHGDPSREMYGDSHHDKCDKPHRRSSFFR